MIPEPDLYLNKVVEIIMVHTCCVPLCASNSRKANNDVSYFNFPDNAAGDKGKLRRQWLKRIRRFQDSSRSWKPLASTKICSDHFDESDFVYRGINKLSRNRRLKKDAIPSRFSWTQEVKRRISPLEKYRELTCKLRLMMFMRFL